MKIKTALFAILAILTLLLVSCQSSQEVKQDTPTPQENVQPTVIEKPIEQPKPVEVVKPKEDIRIVGKKLDPTTITVPVNQESKIYIHNADAETIRIEIRQLNVFEEIKADNYAEIIITPTVKNGIYPIELNGVQLGTLFSK